MTNTAESKDLRPGRRDEASSPANQKRGLRVLLSAYACEPGKGSEPGVGWNWVAQLAKSEEVWVLTRANNRTPIEQALDKEPLEGAHFVYYDLPRVLRFWKKQQRGIRLYYYLWQIGAYWRARRLHRKIRFDVVHHLTFVKYWMPCLLSLLPVPFVWGPVGGGESMPRAFRRGLSRRGRAYECLRDMARTFGEKDPLVRLTARRAALAFATTDVSRERLLALGCRNVAVYGESGLSERELTELSTMRSQQNSTFRMVSSGNLLHLKGFELNVRAFALAAGEGLAGEYWLLGEGPERTRLKALAVELGVADRIVFWGRLRRDEALGKLADCTVFVHPSLHDSGGWVCLEAMAAGLPVICLDLGGPGFQVTGETGIKVQPSSPEQVVRDLADAIKRLSRDIEFRKQLAKGGYDRVMEEFTWTRKVEFMSQVYRSLVRPAGKDDEPRN